MKINGNIDDKAPLSELKLEDLIREGELWENLPNWKVRFSDEEVPNHRRIIEESGFVGLENVLDMGCGFGRLAVFLAERNGFVTGVDRNSGGIEIGARLAEFFDLSNLKFICTDSQSIPLADASQNGVWFYTALQFMNRAAALKEARRVLKPDGKLFVGKYNTTGIILEKYLFGYQNEGRDSAQCKWVRRAFTNGPFGDGGANWTDEKSVSEVFERHGFYLDPSYGCQKDFDWSLSTKEKGIFEDYESLIQRLDTDDHFVEELIDAGKPFIESMPGDFHIVLRKKN